MDRLQHALRLASLGFLISPLRAGTKLPFRGESWQKIQTSDKATILRWFGEPQRRDMNYAVCPGATGVILDPDVDAKTGKDGWGALGTLEAENFEDEPIIGQTFTVRTPRGGRHLYLSTPHAVSNRIGSFPQGIDVRGAGGYVVGPGSHTIENLGENTAEGTYTVEAEDAPIVVAPQWVMSRLDAAGERDENAAEAIGDEDTETAVARIKGLIAQQTSWPTEGQGGDRATYEFICLARNFGAVTEEKMYELLIEPYVAHEDDIEPLSWNERCSPPWDDGDLRRKIENAYSYATSAAGQKGGLLDSLDMAGAEYVDKVDPELVKQREGVQSKLDAMYFPGGELTGRACRREYIIDQWMLAHGMTQLVAFRSTGKSILMVDLCLKIACDKDWFGAKVAEGWTVVYACGEDDEGMQAQMDAWQIQHGLLPEPDRFVVMTGVPDLTNLDECLAWVDFLKKKLPGQKIVLAIDTWQRATAKASQNDDQHMNAATDMIDAMATALGGPSLIAFHPPKGNMETISGSMVIENKGTAIWKMSADALIKKVVVDRIKGKGRGNFIKMYFDEINLPYKDQWGNFSTAITTRFAGNNEGDDPSLKASNSTAQSHWAQIVYDVMLEGENESTPPKFNQKDIATRLLVWKDENPRHESLRALDRLGEKLPTTVLTLQGRLKNIFVAGGPMVPCFDGLGCVYVEVAKGTSNGQKYIRDSADRYRAEHPDKYQEPIPMVPSSDGSGITF